MKEKRGHIMNNSKWSNEKKSGIVEIYKEKQKIDVTFIKKRETKMESRVTRQRKNSKNLIDNAKFFKKDDRGQTKGSKC